MADMLVGLGAAIEALRTELSGARLFGGGLGLQFELEPIELTVQTVVTNEGNGKIGWKLLEFGGSRESEVTQTLTLKMTPVWKRANGEVDRDFTIASSGSSAPTIGPHD